MSEFPDRYSAPVSLIDNSGFHRGGLRGLQAGEVPVIPAKGTELVVETGIKVLTEDEYLGLKNRALAAEHEVAVLKSKLEQAESAKYEPAPLSLIDTMESEPGGRSLAKVMAAAVVSRRNAQVLVNQYRQKHPEVFEAYKLILGEAFNDMRDRAIAAEHEVVMLKSKLEQAEAPKYTTAELMDDFEKEYAEQANFSEIQCGFFFQRNDDRTRFVLSWADCAFEGYKCGRNHHG